MHYTKLDVWLCAMDFATAVYDKTTNLPREETFGLRAQMRRAAVSVPANVAEGEGRRLRRDHARFLGIARGSLYELETQIEICRRLSYISEDDVAVLATKATSVAKLINGTLTSVMKRKDKQPNNQSANS